MTSEIDKYKDLTDKMEEIMEKVIKETDKVIVGQEQVRENLLIAMLCDGNILVESVPGLGKTKMVRTLSEVLGLEFSRIQNTPDLMPSDITGTHIIDESSSSKHFEFQEGPIFANMVLADEINRATPKAQSAMLEAMQEKQVTAGNQTYQLDKPFFVMATQNPLEHEGTFPLSEAQLDRFMMKIFVDYPENGEEAEIVDRFTTEHDYSPELETVLSAGSILKLQEVTHQVPIAEDIRDRAIDIVARTRDHDKLSHGASPRGSLNLVLAAKAHALLEGRAHVSNEDIDAMSKPILRHRIGLDFQAEREGLEADDVIDRIVGAV